MNRTGCFNTTLRITTRLSALFFSGHARRAFYLLIVLLGFITSCKEPDDIGLEVQPVNDKFHPGISSSLPITSYTLREGALRSDETSTNLLGSYVDPIFGKSNCSFVTQVLLSANAPDFTGAVLDSTVLALAYYGSYSDPANVSSLQHVKVFELNTDFTKAGEYYSNLDVSSYYNAASPLADVFVSPHPTTGVFVENAVAIPQLRLNLSSAFGQHLLSNGGSMADNTAFLQFFKGLYVMVDNPAQATSQGAILIFDLLNTASKLTVYYKVNNVRQHFDFIINNTCARVNLFSHDYSSAPAVSAQLSDSTLGQSVCYIQPMSGLKMKMFIPSLSSWTDSMPVVINKAEIIFKIEETTLGTYAPTNKMFLVAVDSLGGNAFLSDQFEGDSYYGGLYNSGTKEYRFNIARHVQQIVSGQRKDYGFYLLCAGASVVATRTVIKGGSNIVLNLSYTKL